MKVNPVVRASLELLGVSLDVSSQDLKKAYHRLALIYHPDRSPNDPNRAAHYTDEFRKITEAYDLLSDPSRVQDLNRKYLRGKLHTQIVDGIEITFGSFFGYRLFDPNKNKSVRDDLLKLTSTRSAEVSNPVGEAPPDEVQAFEENSSILDHAAFDAIEVVYAGRLSNQDESELKRTPINDELGLLPWVVLNNQGILKFLDSDIKRAKKCYEELCNRIPNNIIFMYRLGLCLIIEGLQKPRRTLLGTLKPDMIKIEKGIHLLESCIRLGTERPVGRQKCLVIKKTLADVFERIGKNRRSAKLWREISVLDPSCVEAAYKTKKVLEARKLIKAKLESEKMRQVINPSSGAKLRLKSGSKDGVS